MKLSKCTYGILVRSTQTFKIGMVVGITENRFYEPIPLIKWQHEEYAVAYDPDNLELYKD